MHRLTSWIVLAIVGLAPDLAHAQNDRPAIVPFTINVDQSVTRDLERRLARTRFPDQIAGAGWDYGADLAYLKTLVEYWRTDYDWRAEERELNKLQHYKTRLDGLDIHFVHQRSKHEDAFPLLLVHGWPGPAELLLFWL